MGERAAATQKVKMHCCRGFLNRSFGAGNRAFLRVKRVNYTAKITKSSR